MVDIDALKKLREETAAGVSDCKEALEDSGGDYAQAVEFLRQKGFDKAAAKEGREVKAGIIESYVHAGGQIGALVVLASETDFVSRLDEFKTLAHDVAMQVAAMDPESVDGLLEQPFIKDASKTIRDLVTDVIAKTRENVKILDFKRFQI